MTFNVQSYGATGNGATDDTSAIQAAFDAANAASGGTVLFPVPTSKYVVSAPLKIYSNIAVLASGATIYLKSGSNVVMLKNANFWASDTNFSVTGGVWDGNLSGNPGVNFPGSTVVEILSDAISPVKGAGGQFCFVGVSNVTLSGVTIKNGWGFGVQFVGTGLTATNTFFDAHGRDGFHINGPSSNIAITGVTGSTADDFIALNAWDWTYSAPEHNGSPTSGDITNVTLTTLRPNVCVWACPKMTTAAGAGVRNCVTSDVIGRSTYGGAIIGHYPDTEDPGHTASPGSSSGLVFRDYAMQVDSSVGAGGFTYGSIIYILPGTIDALTLDNWAQGTNSPGRKGLKVEVGATITSLIVLNYPAAGYDAARFASWTISGTVVSTSISQAIDSYDSLVLADGATAYYPDHEILSPACWDYAPSPADASYLPATNSIWTGGTQGASGPFPGLTANFADLFSGTGYLNAQNPTKLRITGQVTMECWVKLAAFPAGNASWILVAKGYDGTNEAYSLRVRDNGGTPVADAGNYAGSGGGNHLATWAISGWPLGTWAHMAGKYNGSAWKVLFNGVEVASLTTASGAVSTAASVSFGADIQNGTPVNFATATIARRAIYNTSVADATLRNHASYVPISATSLRRNTIGIGLSIGL